MKHAERVKLSAQYSDMSAVRKAVTDVRSNISLRFANDLGSPHAPSSWFLGASCICPLRGPCVCGSVLE